MLDLAKYGISKSRIAHSFAQAAVSYDEYAFLQREVADQLLENINTCSRPERILDLGSGTGYCTDKLHALFPEAQIVSLDIAEGMLSHARSESTWAINPICADAESLPFIENSFDLIVSSLAIQWCQDYPRLFTDLHRILRADGEIFLSTFGPKTLEELKLSWQKIDDYVHVNSFTDKELLRKMIDETKYAEIEINRQVMMRNYSSLKNLTKELKAIGAHNMNPGQAKGLGGRDNILKLKNFFESTHVPNIGIPVTYELYFMSLRKEDVT